MDCEPICWEVSNSMLNFWLQWKAVILDKLQTETVRPGLHPSIQTASKDSQCILEVNTPNCSEDRTLMSNHSLEIPPPNMVTAHCNLGMSFDKLDLDGTF